MSHLDMPTGLTLQLQLATPDILLERLHRCEVIKNSQLQSHVKTFLRYPDTAPSNHQLCTDMGVQLCHHSEDK